MSANTVKKTDYYEETTLEVITPSWEVRKLHIAQQIEAACNLPGNMQGPDLGEFEKTYLQGYCSFA